MTIYNYVLERMNNVSIVDTLNNITCIGDDVYITYNENEDNYEITDFVTDDTRFHDRKYHERQLKLADDDIIYDYIDNDKIREITEEEEEPDWDLLRKEPC